MSPRIRPRLVPAALVAIVAAAGFASHRADAAVRTAAPSVRVSIVRDKPSSGDRITLVVRVEGADMVLGSYEGRVVFDPTVFAVDSAVAGRDGSRFVNPADAPHGTIRFAGFTPTGFTSSTALRIVGRTLAPIARANLSATVSVAGDLDGKPVPRAALIPATHIEEPR